MWNWELLRLSWRLAFVDFKLKNEDSYLGIVWYLLNPLFLFLLLAFIFFDRVGAGIEAYPAYLLTGVLMYNFFQRTTIEAADVIRSSGFIKSIAFPREMLVLSVMLKNLLAHVFEAVVFFVVLVFLGVPFWMIIPYLIVLIPFSVFVLGISLFLAAVTAYIIDLGNVWRFFTTLLWFGTPIFYAIEGQDRLFAANLANPLYYFITAARESVVYASIPAIWIMAGALSASAVSFGIGLYVFKRLEYRFAELI